MKKKIYNIYQNILYKLTYLSAKFNFPFLLFVIYIIQLRKPKEIKTKNNNKINLIILEKSGGTHDIINSLKNHKSKKNIFFSDRNFLKIIHDYFTNSATFKDFEKYDVKKEISNLEYMRFLSNFLRYMQNYFKNIEFMTFNFNYRPNFSLQYVCKKSKIFYYVCLKECMSTDGEFKIDHSVYKKYYKNFNDITKVSVYNYRTKKKLISSKLLNKSKIQVIGYPRLNINSKKIKKNDNLKITFFLIDPLVGLGRTTGKETPGYYNKLLNTNLKKLFNWKIMLDDTISTIKKLSIKYPHIEFILKGKVGTHEEYLKKIKIVNYPNIKIFSGGIGSIFLERSDLIIAFGSTVIFESMVLKKNILVPFYKKFRKNPFLEFVHKYPRTILAESKNDLEKKIEKFINHQKSFNEYNQDQFKEYLGNVYSSKKNLRKFLKL